MNCSDFEKRIYLYRELTAKEREHTDRHIAQCEPCRELATQVFRDQALITKISAQKPTIKNPEWLTQRIMNTVERKAKRINRFDGIASFLDSLFVRYAFSVFSVLLITLYLGQQDVDPAKAVAKAEIKQGPVLNTNSFLKAHLNSREKRETTRSVSRYSYYKSERLVKTI